LYILQTIQRMNNIEAIEKQLNSLSLTSNAEKPKSGFGIFVYLPCIDKDHIAVLKNTLYFLYKNYNANFKHDVFIVSRDNVKDQDDIGLGIREECRHTLKFLVIPPECLELPKSIDQNVLDRTLSLAPVKEWGNIEERVMTHFWVFHFWKIAKQMGLSHVMKINFDTYIEEPIREDLYNIVKEKDYNLLFNILQVDSGVCCYGIKDFLMSHNKDNEDKRTEIKSYFSQDKISDLNCVSALKQIHKIVYKKDYPLEDLLIDQPIVCNDSFFVMNVDFWFRTDIAPLMRIIEASNNIFYFKWSLSSIISLVAMMVDKEKMTRCVFRTSNREHREVIDGVAKMPLKYSQSGCITSK